jgi:hypothetical protein
MTTCSPLVTFGISEVIYSPPRLDVLLDLVDDLMHERLNPSHFRLEFVKGFLSKRWGEPTDTIVMLIESAFVHLDTDCPGHLTKEGWYDRLFTIAAATEAMLCIRPPEARRFARVTVQPGSVSTDLSY